MRKLKILTNHVSGGWSPAEKFLGGSEDSVVKLAREFSKDFIVEVYRTPKNKSCEIAGGISSEPSVGFFPQEDFLPNHYDIIIGFKTPELWKDDFDCFKKIHWSSDIEKPWNTKNVDHFVSLTDFHKRKNLFVDPEKHITIPHGVDSGYLKPSSINKKEDLFIYTSSPDRGLVDLLNSWGDICKNFKNPRLKVTYGFDKLINIGGHGASNLIDIILGLSKQYDNIEFLSEQTEREMLELYQLAEYWILPLNNPSSELFCINAIKVRSCNCRFVVNLCGALKNTVDKYIDFKGLVNGDKQELFNPDCNVIVEDWKTIYNKYWKPLLLAE